jgi:GNAT superfamily N-acetyltransferase
MSIEIRPVTPDLAQTFIDYMSGDMFAHSPNWSGCFCRFYHTDFDMDTWIARAPEMNKTDALTAIQAGNMKGYLAFDGDKCVGWCNANTLSAYKRMRAMWPENEDPDQLGATLCFVIHPDYRGKGLARKMLSTAVEGFKSAGMRGVLAFPVKSETEPMKNYRGTLNMYLELGYKDLGLVDGTRVFRLDF